MLKNLSDDIEERADSVCNHWANYRNSPIGLERQAHSWVE